jgi:hypothetical protein
MWQRGFVSGEMSFGQRWLPFPSQPDEKKPIAPAIRRKRLFVPILPKISYPQGAGIKKDDWGIGEEAQTAVGSVLE